MSIAKTVVIVTIVLGSTLSLHNNAQAGLFDWLTGGTSAQTDAIQRTASFDSIFNVVAGSTLETAKTQTDIAITSASLISQAPSAITQIKNVIPRTGRIYIVQVSGYNSEVAQTDDSPFITAKGTHVRDGIVAANMLPFGTFIKFRNCGSLPEDKIFVVEDRMNRRYQNNVDVWFESKADALQLGRRSCEIQVIS